MKLNEESLKTKNFWDEKGYILPGLGDAGDRLNGCDKKEHPRNIIQLLADYGHNIAGLYRSQMFEIEKTSY